MKRNYLGLMAVVAAIILSSFSIKSNTVTDEAYWYRVQGSDLVEDLSGDESTIPRETAATNAPCDEEEGDICALGFDNPQELGEPQDEPHFIMTKSN